MANPIASSNFPKVIAIGCLIVVGLAMVALLLVWLNWGSVQNSELYRSMGEMAEAMDQLAEVRASLLEDYPADSIELHVGRLSSSKGVTHSLTVSLVNPDPALLEARGGEESLAREIALAVAGRFPEVGQYDVVRVSFVRRKKVGITFNRTTNYPFPTADLLAELKGEDDDEAAGDGETADPGVGEVEGEAGSGDERDSARNPSTASTS